MINIMKYEGLELIRELCLLFGPSGCEDEVADFIKGQISDVCDSLSIDRLGNLIARIGNGDVDRKKLMISAHMDEVGFMITAIDEDGYIRFDTVGGIDESVIAGKHVTLGDEVTRIKGVIASKAIHHKKRSERLDVTPITSMYIDVGLSSRDDVLKHLDIGSYATFDSEFVRFGKDGNKIKCKAIDDRLGCALMIEVIRGIYDIREKLPMDIYFCFTTREEIGISGAQVAAQTISPDFAIVLETTAVADIADVPEASRVAIQGEGGTVSLLDRGTIYDREFVDTAMRIAEENGIKAQIKKYHSGGNDAKHIHTTGVGVRTLALSAPTRYLHSPACVADIRDYESMRAHLKAIVTNWEL